MKKAFAIVAAVLTAAVMIGCASVPTPGKKVVYGADGDPRPDWARDFYYEAEDGLYAVASAKMSNRQNSIKKAQADGRTALARQVNVSVKSALQTYTRDTGIPEDTLDMMEEAAVQKTDQMLQGSKQAGLWVAEDETVYVLMMVPYTAIVPSLNAIVSTYDPNPKTTYTVENANQFIQQQHLND